MELLVRDVAKRAGAKGVAIVRISAFCLGVQPASAYVYLDHLVGRGRRSTVIQCSNIPLT